MVALDKAEKLITAMVMYGNSNNRNIKFHILQLYSGSIRLCKCGYVVYSIFLICHIVNTRRDSFASGRKMAESLSNPKMRGLLSVS